MARGKAQAYTLGKLSDRKATILLQLGKNLLVSSVHVAKSPNLQLLNDNL